MIRYIKELYLDWLNFRTIRRNISVLDPIKNQDLIVYILSRYSEENERTINDMLLYYLSKEIIKNNISPDIYRGYMMALEHRIMILQNNKRLLNKK